MISNRAVTVDRVTQPVQPNVQTPEKRQIDLHLDSIQGMLDDLCAGFDEPPNSVLPASRK